jgi:hypothetical protein
VLGLKRPGPVECSLVLPHTVDTPKHHHTRSLNPTFRHSPMKSNKSGTYSEAGHPPETAGSEGLKIQLTLES